MQSNKRLTQLLTPRLNKYIKQYPTAKQQAFLYLDNLDVFFGGAAGPGKSSGMLMAALQYVDCPGYDALIIRNTYANLTKPDALIPRSFEWLANTDATWDEKAHVWTFPSGSTLSFGYLDAPRDHFNYQGPAYQFVGIDEIVQIRENQALYLFSRLRRLKKNNQIPIRFRCTSNPPAPEQIARGSWVKRRYIDKETRGDRIFIPARMEDNPYLDIEEYQKSLSVLDSVTRQQLREGDWNIKATGKIFEREWFGIIDEAPKWSKKIRYWDLAATEVSKENKDPDWTVGLLLSVDDNGLFYIEDIQRFRKKPLDTEKRIRQAAEVDGKDVKIYLEQEPGSSGKIVIDNYLRKVLMGFVAYADQVSKAKTSRANPCSSAAENGNIKIVKGVYIKDFFDELELFPDGEHDDQVDALSGAFNKLTSHKRSRFTII